VRRFSWINFLGVILSDEVAVATEESRDPYGRSNPKLVVVPGGQKVVLQQ
jgi:hypothetical protein